MRHTYGNSGGLECERLDELGDVHRLQKMEGFLKYVVIENVPTMKLCNCSFAYGSE